MARYYFGVIKIN